jgi:hypothetical protein
LSASDTTGQSNIEPIYPERITASYVSKRTLNNGKRKFAGILPGYGSDDVRFPVVSLRSTTG